MEFPNCKGQGPAVPSDDLCLKDVVHIGNPAVLMLLGQTLGAMGLGGGENACAVADQHHVAQQARLLQLFVAHHVLNDSDAYAGMPEDRYDVFRKWPQRLGIRIRDLKE